MATKETIRPTCKDCKFFDPNRTSGRPLGTISIKDGNEAKSVKEGFCRAPGGLSVSTFINEMSVCKMAAGTFQPRN